MGHLVVWGPLILMLLWTLLSVTVAMFVEGFAVLAAASQLRWHKRDVPTPEVAALPQSGQSAQGQGQGQGRLRRFGRALVCPGIFQWHAGDTRKALSHNCCVFVLTSVYVVVAATAFLNVSVKYGLNGVLFAGPASVPLAWVSFVLLPFFLRWVATALRVSSHAAHKQGS